MASPERRAADAGCVGLAVLPQGEDLSLEVRHLSTQLGTLTHEVGTIEARQVALDRRLAEFGGLLQGVQEEQYTQSCELRQSQKAAAVQQALENEDAWDARMERLANSPDGGIIGQLEKKWEARLEEHTRWLMELQSDMAAMTLEGPGAGTHAPSASRTADGERGPLGARISALERGQRTVAVSARRALQTAIIVHQHQQTQEDEDSAIRDEEERRKAVEDAARPLSDLEKECNQRFSAQDERLDRALRLVDTLADRVFQQERALPPPESAPSAGGGQDVAEAFDTISEVREKMEELEANVYGLAAQLQATQQQQAHQQASLGLAGDGCRMDGGLSRESFVVALESLEARVDRSLGEVDRSLNEVCHRLDSLQEGRDQQRLTLRQLGNELPEISQKLDQLWAQCQYYFPRVKEHDVHFSFFRTSFENHKQHMLDLTDSLDRGCLTERGPPGARLPSGRLGEGYPSSHHLGDLGHAGPPLPPPQSTLVNGLPAGSRLQAATALGPAAGSSNLGPVPVGPGSGLGVAPAAPDGADEGPKAKMLAQVMARLYSHPDGVGARLDGTE